MGKSKRPNSFLSGLPASVLESLRANQPNTANINNGQSVIGQKRLAEELATTPLPSKKRKVAIEGLLGPGYEKYDATGLVPFYRKPKDVPENLKKYFYQRERLFSLYDEGCLLDEEGWYSVTPEAIADVIAERCRCGIVLDAFCGVGGNAIAFAKTCERVIAIDTSETRLRLARHNAAIYGVEDRIEFILADYTSFAKAYLSLPKNTRPKIDVVFLSPPWGGIDYTVSPVKKNASTIVDVSEADDTDEGSYNLDRISPIHGKELFLLSRRITPHIAYFLPKHVNLQEISGLLPAGARDGKAEPQEKIEIQEAWMGTKLKAVTCYFGGLVDGQEKFHPF
ncbi:hypothetical protein M422DRAFT_50002 [Sphaerobolus stellatus SS14]|uniref:Trimethylguanosine synthase n=1 Tax=Sphaerobolus stellatus (strain SS14) TaxID=990650 RepID=A0A0C9VL23_SPHS4|nr:hypothetical protein M422DRAFT_50002 [Sphaerobolus stellatus SS14]